MRVPLAASTFTPDELELAAHVLKTQHLTMGVYCESFESQFARYVGRRHAVYVNSGSSANLLAFFSIVNPDGQSRNKRPATNSRGPEAGASEVIVPALTWSTSVWPITQSGMVPVFVDSCPRTLQMDVNQVEDLINESTVAICVPHIMGNACQINELQMIAKRYGLWLIEDCCEALGVRHRDTMVGTRGDMATFSFYFSHHITTIEGGMIVTDDDDQADLLRAMRAHGWIRQMRDQTRFTRFRPGLDPRYLFATTGFNLRPTEINAVLGISQLRKIDHLNAARNRVAMHLKASLMRWDNLGLRSMEITKGTDPAWFGFPIMCARPSQRKAFQVHLEANGIETRPIVCGNLCRHPAMSTVTHLVGPLGLPGADEVMDNGLYIGVHPGMDDEATLAYVCDAFDKFGASNSD